MAFDVVSPNTFGQGAIAVYPSYTTFYTVGNYTRSILKDIDIANNSTNKIRVTIHIVKVGESPSASNILIPDVLMQPKSIMQWSGTQVLPTGYYIAGTASASGATANISGGECV